jgi:hypothetical protein
MPQSILLKATYRPTILPSDRMADELQAREKRTDRFLLLRISRYKEEPAIGTSGCRLLNTGQATRHRAFELQDSSTGEVRIVRIVQEESHTRYRSHR